MGPRAAIGLDIGTSGVRAAQLRFGRSEVTLERFGQVALPEGAVRDGEVADVPAVAAAVKELWTHARLTGKKVVLGVASGRVIVRQVDLSWLPADELRRSLPLQVGDLLPMPVDAALLDFYPLAEPTEDPGTGRTVRGLLVAAARESVEASIAAVQLAGLTPAVVDLTPFAVLRALGRAHDLGMDAEVEALVEVGARVTNVVVHDGGLPQFVRILRMGGQDVTGALGQAAAPADEAALGALVDEVRSSLDYYRASAGAALVSRVVLSGGGAQLAGLRERLQAATRVPVVPGTPLASLRMGETGLSAEQVAHLEPVAAVPVGLALGLVA